VGVVGQSSGRAADIWEMNGASLAGAAILPFAGAGWHAIGAGDFNGDGKSDILWQNTDGAADIWLMNGTSLIGGALLPFPGAGWHGIGTSDFNGDGKADIIWQNDDGTPDFWLMNGVNLINGALLPNPGPTWHVKDDGPISPDSATAGAQQPALNLSAPDAAAPVPMRSAPDVPIQLGRNEVANPFGPEPPLSGPPPQVADPGPGFVGP